MVDNRSYDLAIIDSLRTAAPSIDENSSTIRRPLTMLARVSEVTGCVIMVIHHARKPSAQSAGGPRMAIRGSSGIFDGCDSVLMLEGTKKGPTKVSHEKARASGELTEPFFLRIEDVDIGEISRAGLQVVVEDHAVAAERHHAEAVDEMKARVVDWLREHGSAPNMTTLAKSVGGKYDVARNAIRVLVAEGRVHAEGKRHVLVEEER